MSIVRLLYCKQYVSYRGGYGSVLGRLCCIEGSILEAKTHIYHPQCMLTSTCSHTSSTTSIPYPPPPYISHTPTPPHHHTTTPHTTPTPPHPPISHTSTLPYHNTTTPHTTPLPPYPTLHLPHHHTTTSPPYTPHHHPTHLTDPTPSPHLHLQPTHSHTITCITTLLLDNIIFIL